jgi:hypothetical protein
MPQFNCKRLRIIQRPRGFSTRGYAGRSPNAATQLWKEKVFHVGRGRLTMSHKPQIGPEAS